MATRFPLAPTSDLIGLRRAMDRMLNDSFAPSRVTSPRVSRGGSPISLDVYANDNEAVVLAAIPGVDPSGIDISIEKNTVTLKGEIANAAESEDSQQATWYLHELPWGSFRRSLTLPFAVDADKAQATFQHGLLRLSLPKAEADKPKQIRVQVSGPAEVAATTEVVDELFS